MNKMFFIVFWCVLFIIGCAHNESLQVKFNAIKVIDYSEFRDMSIVNRKGVYFLNYHGSTFKIKRSAATNKISSVEKAFNNDTNVMLTKKDTAFIEHALKSFDIIKVQALSVDEKGNVLLSLPWFDSCTYYFLRLSSSSTLDEINKQHYQNYEDNWYMDKECSER